MNLGFSYVGAIFLLMLFVPNLLWAKNRPKDYDQYAANENRLLLLLERVGEVMVTCCLLIFSDFNIHDFSVRLFWLAAAGVLMLMYEIYWIRYFKSEKTMRDFYRSLCGIPVAGATLPVAACAFIAIYGHSPLLIISDIILGMGHIGIHLNHKKQL